MNGVIEESMNTSTPGSPVSPGNIKKSHMDASDSGFTNNHCDDSSEHSNIDENSDHMDDSEPSNGQAENSNLEFFYKNDNSDECSNAVTVTVPNNEDSNNVIVDNHCSNSNESYSESTDSSQNKLSSVVTDEKHIETIKPPVEEVDSEKEFDKESPTNDDESDEEVDSEEDSSEEDGSDASEEPRAEDTVSINSDSADEAEGEDDSTLKVRKKPKNSEILILERNISGIQNGDEACDSPSTEVHEIVSDNDDCVLTNDEKTNSSNADSKDEPRRRSNRSIRRRTYIDKEDVENGDKESDIEEISFEDPLNQNYRVSKPIVVNDTKTLVEMASKQMKANHGSNQKKEPTVVIIDTNSILSGKVSVAAQHPKSFQSLTNSSVSTQNLYQSIAARGTTVTPVSARSSSISHSTAQVQTSSPPQPIILPSLTDDMFVVEAPSFIVPYVYEKPSVKPFREFVDVLGKELEEQRAKEEQERLEKGTDDNDQKDDEAKDLKDTEDESATEVDASKEVKPATEDEQDDVAKKKKLDKKNRKLNFRRRQNDDDDASWDGESTTDSDEEVISDDERNKTILIKDKEDDSIEEIKENLTNLGADSKQSVKSDSYFDNSLGKFFMNIGVGLVQEYVQTDLLKQQKRKLYKESRSGSTNTKATESAISSLLNNLEFSKENNAPYSFKQKKCEFCSFKTESMLVMAHHLETPHMKNNVYKCNFCAFEIRSPHDILYHMEAEHNTRGRLERAPAYHQCANCPFEDNGKGKLARHLIPCGKKFKPELNLAPPIEWEPPAKIPKITRARNNMMSTYQAAFNRAQVGTTMARTPLNMATIVPGVVNNYRPRGRSPMSVPPRAAPVHGAPLVRGGVMMRHNSPSVLMPANYPMMQNSQVGNKNSTLPTKMLHHQPSISITPLPRPPQPPQPPAQHAKGTFVICEICDGYIKDLEQLRNHMQWIHKVKIHPKMIFNRPPLNCQKCQFRFFTDQGLERHLLGSHGLVTSSMQEAANKGKDAGRCPVCGRVYQWKLLNHVARDHNLTLKPAHLSYKCTVCTATFGMYKQFENHVYSAHSVVAKRVMDKNKTSAPVVKSASSETLLKPLKINDEITIIPQPAKAATTKPKKE